MPRKMHHVGPGFVQNLKEVARLSRWAILELDVVAELALADAALDFTDFATDTQRVLIGRAGRHKEHRDQFWWRHLERHLMEVHINAISAGFKSRDLLLVRSVAGLVASFVFTLSAFALAVLTLTLSTRLLALPLL